MCKVSRDIQWFATFLRLKTGEEMDCGPLQTTAETIMDVATWPKWWSGLEFVQITNEKPNIIGSTAKMTWKASLGYRIHISLTMSEYQELKHIKFSSEGDLKGFGSWDFNSEGENTTCIKMLWNVQANKPWMRALSPLLRRFFIYNHNKLMRDGEAGLNSYILSSSLHP